MADGWRPAFVAERVALLQEALALAEKIYAAEDREDTAAVAGFDVTGYLPRLHLTHLFGCPRAYDSRISDMIRRGISVGVLSGAEPWLKGRSGFDGDLVKPPPVIKCDPAEAVGAGVMGEMFNDPRQVKHFAESFKPKKPGALSRGVAAVKAAVKKVIDPVDSDEEWSNVKS
jgi:hypothetical protein